MCVGEVEEVGLSVTRLEFIKLAPGRRKDICAFIAALKRMGFTADEVTLFDKIKLGWIHGRACGEWKNDYLCRYPTLHGSNYYGKNVRRGKYTLKFGGFRTHKFVSEFLDDQIVDGLIEQFGPRKLNSVQRHCPIRKKVMDNTSQKPFVRPRGHNCQVSATVYEVLTFGRGKLDDNGFWQHSCYRCARAYEKQFPEEGPCWPHVRGRRRQVAGEAVDGEKSEKLSEVTLETTVT